MEPELSDVPVRPPLQCSATSLEQVRGQERPLPPVRGPHTAQCVGAGGGVWKASLIAGHQSTWPREASDCGQRTLVPHGPHALPAVHVSTPPRRSQLSCVGLQLLLIPAVQGRRTCWSRHSPALPARALVFAAGLTVLAPCLPVLCHSLAGPLGSLASLERVGEKAALAPSGRGSISTPP